MMHKTLIAALLLGGVAAADVRIDELLVRRKNGHMNLRVNLSNPSSRTQCGPIKVILYARPDANSAWTKVKAWSNIQKLAPGNRVARDFFDENNASLDAIAGSPAFEARAVVQAPGYPTQEEFSVFHPDP